MQWDSIHNNKEYNNETYKTWMNLKIPSFLNEGINILKMRYKLNI